MTARWVALVVLMVWAFGLRLTQITQPPLDFHAVRQYNSALMARAFYLRGQAGVPAWKREMAANNTPPLNEPPVMEWVASKLYGVVGDEMLALPRAVSALLWTLAALYLFLLALRVLTPDGALVAAAVYLFLPYVLTASRSFQPDPLMTALMVVALYALVRHHEEPTPKRAVIAGVLAGLSVLAKLVSVFFLVAVLVTLAVARRVRAEGATRWWRVVADPQTWLLGLLTVSGTAWYLVLLRSFGLSNQAGKSFYPELWLRGDFWASWARVAANVFGTLLPPQQPAWFASGWLLLGLGLLGVIVSRGTARLLLAAGWVGYLLYGLVFAYHIKTHDYYTLPFVPILALSVGALASWLGALRLLRPRPARLGVALVLLVGLCLLAGAEVRKMTELQGLSRYVGIYEAIGTVVEHSTHTVFLDRNYGYPLRYYGMLGGTFWPSVVDQQVETQLRGQAALTADARLQKMLKADQAEYFIVTDFAEFDQQPELVQALKPYPAMNQPGYTIVDLRPDLHSVPAAGGRTP
jgi:4-amino-4-deoxy-L-arabinose transferase-like glycosyltransferase